MLKTRLLQTYDFPSRALRNLGTFNTNYMDKDALEVFSHYRSVNAVDSHAYPELEWIKSECAEFFLDLFHAKNIQDFRYFTTSGSSEAVLLAMLVLKTNHRTTKPNIIIGSNSHIAWYKAAKYLGVELRVAGINANTLIMDNEQVLALIDDATIGICCTLGAPITLLCDDILHLNHQLKNHHQATGQFIPIHIDAASGGLVFPFVNPDLQFDFSLEHVFSINVSSHKYGFVYPSLGWLFMRFVPCLDDLLDESGYLGVSIKRFSMQFSHSASHIMAQYYYFQTLGRQGYRQILQKLYKYAEQLKQALIEIQNPIMFIDGHVNSLPGLVFSIEDIDMLALSKKLKEKNWYLPVYALPQQSPPWQVARVVIRYGYDAALINNLAADIREIISSS